MLINLDGLINRGQTVGVALSGGADSMALLHFLSQNAQHYKFNIVAINVEHGIRGDASIQDSLFVKNYCHDNGIICYCYQVDCPSFAKENKLSLEQAGRKLRYQCFSDAIESNKCDVIATAHHLSDNAESVLFNLFRGSGYKGLCGIASNFEDKIIRPFLHVTKQEILDYVKDNNLPYVNDLTNFDDDYTRNFLRLNVMPKIKEIFPEAEKSIYRFTQIAKTENEYLDKVAKEVLTILPKCAQIKLPCEKAIFNRAIVFALKRLGIEKDWEKVHVDSLYELSFKDSGKSISLPKNVVAVKEYDRLTLFVDEKTEDFCIDFSVDKHVINGNTYEVCLCNKEVDLKKGLYIDLDKIPKDAVIRNAKASDVFTKFGGGTKKLCDYFTDKKIPKRIRNNIPLIAVENKVLAIFNLAISEEVKVDKHTDRVAKIISY